MPLLYLPLNNNDVALHVAYKNRGLTQNMQPCVLTSANMSVWEGGEGSECVLFLLQTHRRSVEPCHVYFIHSGMCLFIIDGRLLSCLCAALAPLCKSLSYRGWLIIESQGDCPNAGGRFNGKQPPGWLWRRELERGEKHTEHGFIVVKRQVQMIQ